MGVFNQAPKYKSEKPLIKLYSEYNQQGIPFEDVVLSTLKKLLTTELFAKGELENEHTTTINCR